MKPKTKGKIIGGVLGVIPAFMACILYTVIWYQIHGNLGIFRLNLNPIENLPWVAVFALCYVVSFKFLDLISSFYLSYKVS